MLVPLSTELYKEAGYKVVMLRMVQEEEELLPFLVDLMVEILSSGKQ